MRIFSIALVTSLITAACGEPRNAPAAPGDPAPAETAEVAPARAHDGHDRRSESDAGAPRADHAAHEGDKHDHGTHHLGRRFVKADDYVGMFDDPKRDRWQRPAEVIKLMAITPGMTAADIGAGTGYFLPHLSRAVGKRGAVLALDIEPDMVRHMTERARDAKLANVTARQVEPDDPKLAARSVDRILIVNTWHHIGERRRYAARLAAALRPGGRVVIVDYPKDAPRGPPANHRLDPEVIAAELASAGLRTEIATESLPYQYVVIGRAR